MGSKSGKSGSDYAAPPPVVEPDNSQIEMMMGSFMEGMMGMMAGQQAATKSALDRQTMLTMESSLPESTPVPEVDWGEKNKELSQKMKANYNTDMAKKLNRTSTILTSPLLDNEEVSTTSSILGSG